MFRQLVHLVLCFVLFVGGLYVATLSVQTTVSATESSPASAYVYERVPDTAPVPSIPAYIVIDEATGEVLTEKDAGTVRPIASLAKLVVASTLYSADLVPSTATATATVESRDVEVIEDFGKLAVGQVYTPHELLFPYLMESSNDAGALLERVWGDAVRDQVTTLISRSRWPDEVSIADVNGLSPRTAASPRALAYIARQVAQTEPAVFDMTRLPRYVGQSLLVNNSPFVAEPWYEGGKHGYTEEAGRTYVTRISMSFADGERTLIVVALGAKDYVDSMTALRTHLDATIARVSVPVAASGILSASSQ